MVGAVTAQEQVDLELLQGLPFPHKHTQLLLERVVVPPVVMVLVVMVVIRFLAR